MNCNNLNYFAAGPIIFPNLVNILNLYCPSNDSIIDTLQISHISEDAIKTPINYFAKDSMPHDIENNIITLYGDAWIEYGDIKLEAAKIIMDWNDKLITASGVYDSTGKYSGTPVFTDEGTVYRTNKMIYNFKTKRAKIYDLKTQEGEGYIHGKVVKKDSNDVICFQDAKYTTCELDHPHFYISAQKIKIIPGKNIITGPAYLTVSDVPLPLGIPFGFFPEKNKRSSGIKIPTYGESRDYFGLVKYSS